MAVKVTIDRGVPVPMKRTYASKYPFVEMAIGDSFLLDGTLKTETVRSAASAYGKDHQKTFTVRMASDGTRCWRIA